VLIQTVDLEKVLKLESNGRWDQVGDILIETARNLEKAGAKFILICNQTLHKLYEKV